VIYRSLQAGNDQHLSELFTAGLSLQNFGTAMKSQLSAPGLEGQSASQTETSMPHYLRAGGSYSLTKPSGRGNGLLPFQLVLTGELRYLLNSGALETTNRLGAGVGGESLIYELLSIRLGVLTNPDNTEYATGGEWTYRFGLGLNFPLRLIGIKSPLTLQGEYAAIPVDNNSLVFPASGTPPTVKSFLHVFSVSLRYEEDVF
jgi:hypothetical protein